MVQESQSCGRLLKLPELSRRLDLDYDTVLRAAKEDQLPVPVVRVGARLYVWSWAVDNLLAQRKPSEATHVEQREDGR